MEESTNFLALTTMLQDLSDAIQSNDLSLSSRLSRCCVALSHQDPSLQTLLNEQENQILIQHVTKQLMQWQRKLQAGDYAYLESPTELLWYRVKIKSITSKVISVHFDKWGSKYDQEFALEGLSLLPDGAVQICKRKNKPLVLSSSSSSSSLGMNNEEGIDSQEGEQLKEMTPSSSSSSTAMITESIVEESIATTTETTSPTVTLSRSGRVIKSRIPVAKAIDTSSSSSATSESNALSSSTTATTKISTKKRRIIGDNNEDEEEDINDWVCGICWLLEAKKGTKLLLCDGPCLRSFHIECLSYVPDEGESWLCENCVEKRHKCFVCGEIGEDGKDVCRCSTLTCGKYYHATCLEDPTQSFICPTISWRKPADLPTSPSTSSKRLTPTESSSASKRSRSSRKTAEHTEASAKVIEIKIEAPSNAAQIVSLPSKSPKRYWQDVVGDFSFKCSYHVCDTCSEFYGKDNRPLFKCIRCPRAFHVNCIPPGTRFNALILLCPLHPECVLPTELGRGQLDQKSEFNPFWEQMTLPEECPRADQLLDNHFYLPSQYRFQSDTGEPKPFKMLSRLTYDALPEKEKSVPLHVQEEHCECADECGPRCLNRILCVECDDKICNVKGNCGNRLFSNRAYSQTERIREEGMGFGLRAAENIDSGRLVLEYLGEVIDDAEMRRRLENQRIHTPSDKDYYVMQLEHNLYVDGKHMGNDSRFINHSCDPNCELQVWMVKGRMHIGIFAIRDIAEGEPLSYDYQFDTNESNVFRCYCRTAKCRGTMAPKRKSDVQDIASLSGAQRHRLVAEARYKLNKSPEQRQAEEWQLSCTGKFLPGEQNQEVRFGPTRNAATVRAHHLFLPRNARRGRDFFKRKGVQ